MDVLDELQRWYSTQCNGEWEQDRGIQIESCDNPGWWVKIDVAGTVLASREFQTIAESVDSNGCQQRDRWLYCRLANGVWHGAGDETKLRLIIKTFIDWALQP